MNSAELLAHFDRFGDSSDAISRLRRFILDLAVRGRLVEHRPDNEPASALLRRCQAEKVRLVKEGKIRDPRVFNVTKRDDELFPVPAGWVWCHLSEVGAIAGGGTPPSADASNFTAGGSGIPWLTPADLGKHVGLFVAHGERDLTQQGLRSSSATMLPAGSVLFTSRAPIGYTAIAANELSTNQGFKSVIPFVPNCNLYIALYFRAFAKWIDAKAPGTTFREVSGKKVAYLPFPLPPLAEQSRIVVRADELMTLCDRLEAARAKRERQRDRVTAASLQRLTEPADASDVAAFRNHASFHISHISRFTSRPDQIQSLRQAILSLAVRGRLVPQDFTDEPASELLKHIHAEKAQLLMKGQIKRVKSPPVALESRLTIDWPQGWELDSLQSLCISIADGDHQPPPKTDRGVPFLVIGNVRWRSIEFNGCRHVTDEYFNALDPVRRPRKGDILYTLVGSFGIPVIVSDDRPFCIQRHIGILRPSTNVSLGFLARALESRFVFAQASACATGIAQKTVPLAGLRAFQIPVPPLREQLRIAAKVDELMAVCDRLETQLTNTQAANRRLLDAVLHEALASAA